MFANLRRTIIIMKLSPFLTRLQIIIIVNSVFLQRPQKRSRGNQLIHRRLSKTKSIGSRSDPESEASSRTFTPFPAFFPLLLQVFGGSFPSFSPIALVSHSAAHILQSSCTSLDLSPL